MSEPPRGGDGIVKAFLLIMGPTLVSVGLSVILTVGAGFASVMVCVLGAGGLLAGLSWDRLKQVVPEKLATSLYDVASDARWWVGATFAVALYAMALSLWSPRSSDTAGGGNDVAVAEPVPTGEMLDRSLREVVGLYQDRTLAEGEQLTARFIGRRVEIRAPIVDVWNSGGEAVVVLAQDGKWPKHLHLDLEFPSRWKSRLQSVRPERDMIVSTCSIRRIRPTSVSFSSCDAPEVYLIPTPTPEPTPSATQPTQTPALPHSPKIRKAR